MSTRAISRVPIELWRIIFFDVVSPPLLPFIDLNHTTLSPGIIDCLYLFDRSCDFYRRYRTYQSLVTEFRLVCRQWDAALQDISNRCSVTNIDEMIGPIKSKELLFRAERVQIEETSSFPCTCPSQDDKNNGESTDKGCIMSKCFSNNPFKRGQWLPDEILEAMINAPTKILTFSLRSKDSEKLLPSAPNLRALLLDIGRHFRWSSVVEETFRRLTHLSLLPVGHDAVVNFPLDMKLNDLCYLSLHLWLVRKPQQSAYSISNWAFPKLRSLLLTGYIDTSFSKDVEEFVKKCGKSVTELVFSLQYYDLDVPPIDTRTLWDMFPRLRVYGCTLGSLVSAYNFNPISLTLNNNIKRSILEELPDALLTIVLTEFTPLNYHNALIDPITSLISQFKLWKVDKIVVQDTWSQLQRKLKKSGKVRRDLPGSTTISVAHRLLLAIVQSQITVCDKSGDLFLNDETWEHLYFPDSV
jgi:hypothetical protein